MTDLLEPDRHQIERWFANLFRHAGREGYVSMRAYTHNNKPILQGMWTSSLTGGLAHVFDDAYDVAYRAATYPEPAVFCPPAGAGFNATGKDRGRAREQDLLLGLVISVELDDHPEEGRLKLQDILGEPTMIVKSGGQWTNGDGEQEDKLHMYWRLAKPAKGDDLKKPKLARDLATRVAGGDSSNKPIVHCLRCAGSIHRKSEPKLCTIYYENPDREIDLSEALALLEAAAHEQTSNGHHTDYEPRSHEWRDVFGSVLHGKDIHDSTVPLQHL